ncbi:MAG TPA: MarR family transcriptional regulator [Terracidiphilus sp.]|jgi:DNA-binding MarR family transcriptional regulator|nr:MarR family transcriptional regulator [Terracidiphilus sp.]
MAALKHEIVQERPFSGPEEEALLNLMRTADCLQRAFQRISREWGVTGTQYNVLRILRGSHPQGLTCSAIGDRMITAEPDITRLLARLKALKLVRQHRDRHDRRVVWTQISEVGLDLLRQMDPTIQQEPRNLLGHLSQDELVEFIRLLERARKPCLDAQNGVRCDGNTASEPVTCDGTPAPDTAMPKAESKSA